MVTLILRHKYTNAGWSVHIMGHRVTLTQYIEGVNPPEKGGYQERTH
jgi:hypothetical protein